MPQQPDPVADYLRTVRTSDAVRAQAWAAVEDATDDDDLTKRLTLVPVPNAVRARLFDLYQPSAAPVADFHTSNETDANGRAMVAEPKSIGGFIRNAGSDIVDNVVIGTLKMLWPGNWPEIVRGINEQRESANADFAKAAEEVSQRGVDVPTFREAVSRLGEHTSHAADEAYRAPVSTALGLAGPFIAGRAPKARPSRVARIAPQNANPVTRSAVEFGLREGIPVDAATATGTRAVLGAQKIADDSIGGSVVSGRARTARDAALQDTSARLANRTSPAPASAEQAGAAVRRSLTRSAEALDTAADTAYGRLRAFEAEQSQTIARTGGVQAPSTAAKPFTNIPLAVDIAPTKAAMRPVYEALTAENKIVPFISGSHKGRALVALDRLMGAPDMAPLSIADAAASELKALARVDQTFRRTAGQGVAAQAVTNLEKAIRETAAQATRQSGKPVTGWLMEGRAATINKVKIVQVLDKLADEPVRLFQQLTAGRDTAVGRLREVQRIAPSEMPKLGRAVLEGLFEKATAEGGFGRAQGILADWQRLGPQTKQMLFGSAQHVKDLDDFFMLARRFADNANPSNTSAQILRSAEGALLLTNPLKGVAVSGGAVLLSSLLHSPRVTRALVYGLRLPSSAVAGRRLALSQVVRAARDEGIPIGSLAPTLASDSGAPAQ